MARRVSARTIAVVAVLFALEILFICVPVSVAGVSLALCLVPVMVAAMTQSRSVTAILTVLMAVGLWASSFVSASPLAPLFRNPIVALPARLAVGIVAYALYHGLSALLRRRYDSLCETVGKETEEYRKLLRKYNVAEHAVMMAATLLSTLTNTAIVCLMIWLCYIVGSFPIDSSLPAVFFQGAVAVNAVIEAAVFTVIVPPVVWAVRKAGYGVDGRKK